VKQTTDVSVFDDLKIETEMTYQKHFDKKNAPKHPSH
jgi:hypothetical protein